mgnify:CR=1 FL=1
MSPAASKTKAKAAAKPSIVMLADSSGKAKPVKPAAEETPAKAKKARTPRTRAAALPKGTDLKAAADELLAAADGKTKAAKKTTKASSTKTKTAKAKTTTAALCLTNSRVLILPSASDTVSTCTSIIRPEKYKSLLSVFSWCSMLLMLTYAKATRQAQRQDYYYPIFASGISCQHVVYLGDLRLDCIIHCCSPTV